MSSICPAGQLGLDTPLQLRHPSANGQLASWTKEGQAMQYQTESKPQGWRAVAVFEDRPDLLIYLGRSSTQVRAGFASAFFELLDDEEREAVRGVRLERWHGAPDAGRWMQQTMLTLPTAKLA